MIIMKYSQFFVRSMKGIEVGLQRKILSFRDKLKHLQMRHDGKTWETEK